MPKGGDKFYYRHSQAVEDGTRCREDSLDICIQGICMAVGCDMMLGSDVKEDKCQECGGDGSHCKTVEGIFDQTNLHVGYNDIILIPAGATTIKIKELEPTNNYLAIRNSSGYYYLNGNWQIEFPRKLKFAGTHFHYEKLSKGYVGQEYIHASGPTTEPIFIALLYQQKNLGISYEYSIPHGISNTQPDGYVWIYSNYGTCSRTCGGGIQTRNVNCATTENYEVVADYLCDVITKPPPNQTCNENPCPAHWQVSNWDECSVSCGGGVQYRQVHCQRDQGGSPIMVPDSECIENNGERPVYARACNDVPCPTWKPREWSVCDHICGEGTQQREVDCVMAVSDQEKVIGKQFCGGDEPASTQSCFLRPCEGTEWIVSEWSSCDSVCGLSMETREAYCASEDGNLHEEEMCSGKNKPSLERPCSKHTHCGAMWHASQWSECSSKCGKGMKTRTVFCGKWKDGEVHKVSDEECSTEQKMASMEDCYGKKCNGMWFTGPWTRCSVPCGGGQQTRKVLCLLKDTVLEHDQCNSQSQPFEVETCNMHPCDEDEVMIVGGCHKSKHGCCSDGITPAGPDYIGCPFDGSEQDCRETEFGCCIDGATPASGPFGKGCPKMINCNETKYGCCPDGATVAKSADMLGCFEDCENSLWGCCADGFTPALGKNNEGCEKELSEKCEKSQFGCCPDGFSVASGSDYEGCDLDVSSGEDCLFSEFGCCPDGLTSATGPDMRGCRIGKSDDDDCAHSKHGCCEDGISPAQGPNYLGCEEGSGDIISSSCEGTLYGCCPDDVSPAKGPGFAGCEVPKHDDDDDIKQHVHHTPCSHTTYGCCKDEKTAATGPYFEGCKDSEESSIHHCANTVFGCCPDGKTSALGPNKYGCCFKSEFGCCPDNITISTGPYNLGCSCHTYPHGCCPDGITVAKGPRFEGCSCEHSSHGCCQDNFSYAKGPNFEGCECSSMLYGCCPDDLTPAMGPNNKGCDCDRLQYGCCPDEITASRGPNHAGCPCKTFPHGCCPDGKTASKASGPYNEGCPCHSLIHGCCPDNRTAAVGPRFEGCPCTIMSHGCCPDKRTPALGPNFHGCPCKTTTFGCCPDGESPALGPKYKGCHCITFPYGCCPDGVTPARDQNLGGCKEGKKVQTNLVTSDVCSLPKERGPCHNFSVKWYFDVTYGGCSRFWYGGCDGNGNQFNSQEECENVCVNPEGPEACMLPRVFGPCKGAYPSWYYEPQTDSCKSFNYSGCLGNNNRFTSRETCENTCVRQVAVDACDQPMDVGPCKKVTQRWFFDRSEDICKPFIFGGCQGNHNNFETEKECKQRCIISKPKEPSICHLPQVMGNCYQFRERWYYNPNERRCQRFYYSGCGGNDNNFATYADCEKQCEKSLSNSAEDFSLEYCSFEPDAGPCHGKKIQWFYDKDGVCKQFYYGGCRGNGNRFNTKKDCEQRCAASQDICKLPKIRGPCSGSFTQWYFETEHGECREFTYSGCQGNGNRFNDKESCEIQCKKWPSVDNHVAQDACNQQKDQGPCLGYFLMWYYDSNEGSCRTFVYGGCHGNDNRFTSLQNCEAKCHTNNAFNIRRGKETHSITAAASFITNEDICRLSPDEGHCSYSQSRWYYDAHKGMCLPFVYKGCGGNKNRFKNDELCMRFCSGVQASGVVGDAAVRDFVPVEVNKNCPASNCGHLQCPHGIEEIVDVRGCISCLCSNPCENHNCPDGSQCVVEKHRRSDGDIRSQPLCRLKNKKGECPSAAASEHLLNGTCHDRCQNDADCPGGLKCCFVSCAKICLLPVLADDENEDDENSIEDLDTPAPPQILTARKDVAVKKGTPALLRCIVRGYPTPKISWHHKNHPLVTDGGAHKISLDGSLHIMAVKESDGGMYTCTADNGIGKSVTRFFNLIVYEDTKVSINLATEQYQVGKPLQLDCTVKGTPPFEVTWHLGSNSPALQSDSRREIFSNHTLLIASAQYNDSGTYVCEARNQHGKADATLDVQVHDIPVPSTCKDSPFFASCAMIVKQNYCVNPTYAKYCCLSCAIAGQSHRTDAADS
ncbi:papilin-like [Uloborus diversus]|uniref:papilin-like n=1 Tax=Uloborus diversus TaxID=327109 RepID=UPI002409782B|nr:papilin-like [Uloborus diversus]